MYPYRKCVIIYIVKLTIVTKFMLMDSICKTKNKTMLIVIWVMGFAFFYFYIMYTKRNSILRQLLIDSITFYSHNKNQFSFFSIAIGRYLTAIRLS